MQVKHQPVAARIPRLYTNPRIPALQRMHQGRQAHQGRAQLALLRSLLGKTAQEGRAMI